jgi:hypothetical protein
MNLSRTVRPLVLTLLPLLGAACYSPAPTESAEEEALLERPSGAWHAGHALGDLSPEDVEVLRRLAEGDGEPGEGEATVAPSGAWHFGHTAGLAALEPALELRAITQAAGEPAAGATFCVLSGVASCADADADGRFTLPVSARALIASAVTDYFPSLFTLAHEGGLVDGTDAPLSLHTVDEIDALHAAVGVERDPARATVVVELAPGSAEVAMTLEEPTRDGPVEALHDGNTVYFLNVVPGNVTLAVTRAGRPCVDLGTTAWPAEDASALETLAVQGTLTFAGHVRCE